MESPKQQLGKTQQLELEFDLTRVRDVRRATLAGDLWCGPHEAGKRKFATCHVSVMPLSEVAVGWKTRSCLDHLCHDIYGCVKPAAPSTQVRLNRLSLGALLEPWRLAMAKFDYGLWIGNFVAVVLVALALTYFISLLRSVMDMDLKDLKLSQ